MQKKTGDSTVVAELAILSDNRLKGSSSVRRGAPTATARSSKKRKMNPSGQQVQKTTVADPDSEDDKVVALHHGHSGRA